MLSHLELMHGMSVLHLNFGVRAKTTIAFSDQPGSALRGSLYAVLSDNFCSEPFERVTPGHQERCPVCWLLAAEDITNRTGRNIPRPLTIQPPLKHTFTSGETFSFGISLMGKAQDFLPFVTRAVQKMGSQGVGKGRGNFELMTISEVSPVFDASRELMKAHTVRIPTLHVTPAQIAEATHKGNSDRLTVDFLSPMRLVANGELVQKPHAVAFFQRLIERCQSLAEHYGDQQTVTRDEWREVAQLVTQQAAQLRIAYDHTQWCEVWSGSQRIKGYTPISGFMGTVRWEGDVRQLRAWALWGQSLHVGKDTVKGNGWYKVKA